jgi:hypothetical protein
MVIFETTQSGKNLYAFNYKAGITFYIQQIFYQLNRGKHG